MTDAPAPLLGPSHVRALAADLGIVPSRSRGQNFLHDGNTVRRIVGVAGVGVGDRVLEVGPGMGSLTLGLLETGASVVAVEIDPVLAEVLPQTVARHQPGALARLQVLERDALTLDDEVLTGLPGGPPETLAANLPYSMAVLLLITLLERLPSVRSGVVMVQREVADRLTAKPGSKAYGGSTLKLAWFAEARFAGAVGRRVFWPEPRVDSGLVSFERVDRPGSDDLRGRTFALVDAAFGQRRKTLRAALAGNYGSPSEAQAALEAADIDPSLRGEALTLEDYVRLARGGSPRE